MTQSGRTDDAIPQCGGGLPAQAESHCVVSVFHVFHFNSTRFLRGKVGKLGLFLKKTREKLISR